MFAGAHALQLAPSRGFLPIFMMHGMNGRASWFSLVEMWIRQLDPEVTMKSFPVYEGVSSLRNLWLQGDALARELRAMLESQPDLYTNGYTLLCHSQGALLCRSVIQRMDDHRAHTLIALTGPQAGVFGVPSGSFTSLPWVRNEVYHFAYTEGFQDHLSIANYWHDPRPMDALFFHPAAEYENRNTFLPVMNNDPLRETQGYNLAKNDTEAARYKSNLLRLRRAVFLGSSADDQIIPWDSAIFNFYGQWPGNGTVPLELTPLWTEDWLGLRALNESGRLVRKSIGGVCHDCWVRNESVFLQHVLRYLPLQS